MTHRGGGDAHTRGIDHSECILTRHEIGDEPTGHYGAVVGAFLRNQLPRVIGIGAVDHTERVEGEAVFVESPVEEGAAQRAVGTHVVGELEGNAGVPWMIGSHFPIAVGQADDAGQSVGGGMDKVVDYVHVGVDGSGTGSHADFAICEGKLGDPLGSEGDEAGSGSIGNEVVVIDHSIGGFEGEGERLGCDGIVEQHPLVDLLVVVGEESDRDAVAVGIVGGAAQLLAEGDSGGVALMCELVNRIVDETGMENLEVEKAFEVYATILAEAVAERGGIEVAESASVEQAAHAGVEEAVAHNAAKRMPHEGTFVVGSGAIGVEFGHARKGTETIVVDMGGTHNRAEIVEVVFVRTVASKNGFTGHLLTEGCAPFVNPHIAFGGAGDKVAEPCMAQLVTGGHGAWQVI